MKITLTRWGGLRVIAALAFITLAGCASLIPIGNIGEGKLKGHVLVEWYRQDKFVYRKQDSNVFSFHPSFMAQEIIPKDMYTDGGSVPRIFWSIPGLSPWGLGPAYIIHDWIFLVHRCNLPGHPEISQITFEQSALVLAEVAKSLVKAGLIDHNLTDQVVWAVQTRYARGIWDRPGTPDECAPPFKSKAREQERLGVAASITIVDFTIPSGPK